MRALRALAFSASAFCFSLPLMAHANFEMNSDAQASTLPAFQSNASPGAQYTAGSSNPANYYANTLQVANAAPQNLQAPLSDAQQQFIKKQQAANMRSANPQSSGNLQPGYAQPQPMSANVSSIAPLSGTSDPGVGPVVIEGQNTQPVVIEGQPKQGQFEQVGYGYAPVEAAPVPAPTASNVPSVQPSTAAYSTQGGYAPPAPAPSTYGAQTGASPYGSQQTYGAQAAAPAYGNAYGSAAPAPAAAAPTYAPQGSYGANSYGMSGYGSTYGAQPQAQVQTSPGMLSGTAQAPAYGSAAPTYAAPQAAPAYNSGTYAYGSTGSDPYATTTQAAPYSNSAVAPATTAPAYPNYGAATQAAPAYGQPQGTSSGAYPGYGSSYNATPAPQPAYGYGAPAPQAQPDYGQGYAPYPAQQQQQPAPMYAPGSSSNTVDKPSYSVMDYAVPPGSKASSRYDNAVSLAMAPPDAGRFYGTIRTGLGFQQKTKFTDLTSSFEADYKTGWQIGGAVGYTFPSLGFISPRAELEVNNKMASVDSQTVGGTVKIKDPDGFGTTDTLRVFANGYFDIDTPMRRTVTPYIGGGVGIGLVDYDRHGTTPSGVQLSKSDTGFAYNVGAGLSFPLFTRGTTLDIGYRYSQVLGLEFTALDGSKSKMDIGGHEITAGLRQRF